MGVPADAGGTVSPVSGFFRFFGFPARFSETNPMSLAPFSETIPCNARPFSETNPMQCPAPDAERYRDGGVGRGPPPLAHAENPASRPRRVAMRAPACSASWCSAPLSRREGPAGSEGTPAKCPPRSLTVPSSVSQAGLAWGCVPENLLAGVGGGGEDLTKPVILGAALPPPVQKWSPPGATLRNVPYTKKGRERSRPKKGGGINPAPKRPPKPSES